MMVRLHAILIDLLYAFCMAGIIPDNTGWSATKKVYGDIKHLLCFWHVDR